MKAIHLLAVVSSLIVFRGSEVRAQSSTSLAIWTFETSQPSNIGPYKAEGGLYANESLAGVNQGAYVTNAVGSSGSSSFSAGNWIQIGSVPKYFEFKTTTTGYSGITLSFDQYSSSNGPASFDIFYKTSETDFKKIDSTSYILKDPKSGLKFTSKSFDLSSTVALNDAETVFLQIRMKNGSKSTDGGAIKKDGSSGNLVR